MMKRDIASRSSPESAVRWNIEIARPLEQFPIHIEYDKRLFFTTKHNQPGLEIHITQEGRAAFLSRGKLLLQKHRHVLLHNAEKPHQFIGLADQKFRRTVICLDRRLVDDPTLCLHWLSSLDLCHLELNAKTYSQLMEHCRRLSELLHDRKPGWEQLVIAHLLQAAVGLELFHTHQAEEPAGEHREEISALVQQCVHYVYHHLEEKLTLDQMAEQFSISREHLTRSFTKQLGISFYQFVLGARVDYAKQLMLDDPELSVTDVALLAGFSTQPHFSSIFRRFAECSPTQYRQQLAELKESSP
ncbi:MAG: transcriptional regulator, AraC family [Paenibacillus sp.]|jgi:AraC-like DNA-binding protein|nr:transcriptional regulator, AraC family [Paenibacillus sp.]